MFCLTSSLAWTLILAVKCFVLETDGAEEDAITKFMVKSIDSLKVFSTCNLTKHYL